jgi:hypothetical protein
VATFYLLPSPLFLGRALERQLEELFPGVHWDEESMKELAEHVAAAVARHPATYVIHRHELPDGEDMVQAVVDGFGAEAGDEVIEVRAGKRLGAWHIRRQQVNRAA